MLADGQPAASPAKGITRSQAESHLRHPLPEEQSALEGSVNESPGSCHHGATNPVPDTIKPVRSRGPQTQEAPRERRASPSLSHALDRQTSKQTTKGTVRSPGEAACIRKT